MVIALLTNGIFPYVIGGMQKHSYYLAKHLAKSGIYVDIYFALYPEIEAEEGVEDLFSVEELKYINWIRVDRPRSRYFPSHYIRESYLTSVAIYNSLVERPPVDFIYAQGFAGWKTIQQKQRGEKLPPIGVNSHGLEMYQRSASIKALFISQMFRPFVRFNLTNADYALSLGGGLSQIMASIGVSPDCIIESANGVAKEWLYTDFKTEANSRTFVFLGRYERRKGIDELHRAILKIDSKYKFHFHFIGPIPENLRVELPYVTYWGLVKDEKKVKNILRSSDVLVCPSYSEGMPTVILEAMASGMAIIGTQVGAVDALVSKQNGWLIPPGNEKALKVAIEEAILIADKDLNSKKEKSQAIIKEDYLWNMVAQKTLEGITGIL